MPLHVMTTSPFCSLHGPGVRLHSSIEPSAPEQAILRRLDGCASSELVERAAASARVHAALASNSKA